MIERFWVLLRAGIGCNKVRGYSTILLLLTSLAASAQDASRELRGGWYLETPEKGSFILVLKGQGLASYFWGDNSDRTVYQGTWTFADGRATISWPDGSQIILSKTSTGSFTAVAESRYGESFISEARQLPRDVLGQWAKPPERVTANRSDLEEAEGFFGTWIIDEESGLKHVFIEPDRSTASTLGKSARGQRGQWARQGRELHIIWDSGEYSILSETERGFTYKQVSSGTIIETDETPTVPARRTNDAQISETWMQAYEAERELAGGGIAFASRKSARAFYRGDWIVQREEGVFERIEIKRFGGLATSSDRSLGGQWRQSGQDIYMNWDDGMRKILSPVGEGFVLYEFRPGRPLDGVPTRVLAATPSSQAKLDKYLSGRVAVAQQMREVAIATGIPEAQRTAGWGRNFARWVWPFGGSEAETADELIAEETAPESQDPWWWPSWSEKKDEKSDPSATVSDSEDAASTSSAENRRSRPHPKHQEKEWLEVAVLGTFHFKLHRESC